MAINQQSNAYSKLLRLVALSPFYYATIALEALLESYFSLRFPRNHRELISHPQKLFKLLKSTQKQSAVKDGNSPADRLLPTNSEFISLKNTAALANEPDKNKTAGNYTLTYQVNGKQESLALFIKFQCGRGLPLWLQSVRAAAEPGIAREVMFYQRLAGQVGVRSPQPYYADSIHRFNRVCLVLEQVDGFALADWEGCPVAGIRAILKDVAQMNAKFLGLTATDQRTAWIPAREGLDNASFIRDFIKNEPLWYQEIWAALESYFKRQPVTLIHGDCRPGNMLFLDDGSLAEQINSMGEDNVSSWPADTGYPEVVFTDWEAINVGPLLSDFNYCVTLGLSVASRRTHQECLLEEFLLTLQDFGISVEHGDWKKCRDEVDLLRIVLYCGDVAIRRKGFWSLQGNTKQDDLAWVARVDAALIDIDVKSVAKRLNVAEETIEQLKRRCAKKT